MENITYEYEEESEVYITFSFWFNGVFTLILLVISQLGNIAIFASFRYKTRYWLALYYYFVTFAFWNTILSLSTVFLYCLPAIALELTIDKYFIYCRFYSYPLANISMTATFWLVVAITLERYYATSHPLNHHLSQKKLRAKLISLLICILAPVYNLPLFFDLNLITFENDPFSQIEMSTLRKNLYYQIFYRGLGNILFVSAVPLSLIFVLNFKIIYILTKNKRSKLMRRRSLSNTSSTASASQSQKMSNLFLTLITLKFVVCHTFPVVLNVVEVFMGKLNAEESLLYRLLVDVSNFFVVMDSATNALLYFSWRKRISTRKLSFRTGMATHSLTITPVMVSILAAAKISTDMRRYPRSPSPQPV